MLRKLLKTWFHARDPRLQPVAEGLSELGLWANTFDSETPIDVIPVHGGVKVRWNPQQSPFAHPWRVTRVPSTPEHVDVRGGIVYDGTNAIAVAGLTDQSAIPGTKVWLRIHYHNDLSATDICELVIGTDWPADVYQADVVPDAGTATAFPYAGWCTSILRVAEVDSSGNLVQYLYQDLRVPKGGTYTLSIVVGHRWNGLVFEAIMITETRVNGVPLPLSSAPVAVPLFDVGDCTAGGYY